MKAGAFRATVMLTVVTLLWGLSFPFAKTWHEAAKGCPGGVPLASFTWIGLRMVLALLILAAFKPRVIFGPSRREYRLGASIGVLFFLGFALQVVGAAWTTPALSAFITSLASAWVPLIAFVCFRKSFPVITIFGLSVGIVGIAVLTGIDTTSMTVAFGWGEGLTFVGTLLFAVQILLLDRWGKQVESVNLTAGMLGMAGLGALVTGTFVAAREPGLTAWLQWTVHMLQDPAILLMVIAATVFSTVLAFYWMNAYQPRLSVLRAALIYLLEPVFAAIFSILWGYDELTAQLLWGSGLVIVGNLLAEVRPVRLVAPYEEGTTRRPSERRPSEPEA